MKLSGLTAAYRDGVGNISADLSALGLRAEEVLSFVGAAASKKVLLPSSPSKSSSPSPSPSPPAARPRQLAVRATATFKTHPSRSPSPVRRAAAALADVLALTSPEKARRSGGRKQGDDDDASCGGLPQSPAIAEAFRAAGFAAGRPPTESEEGQGAATLPAASSVAAAAAAVVSAAAASTVAEEQKPHPPRRRFWPPAAHAANSSPLKPPAMTRPAAAAAARAVRFDLSAYETPPPQTRKRRGGNGSENENEKRNAAAACKDDDKEEDQDASSDADDEACIASLMAQGQAASSAGRHAAAAAAYGSAAKLAAGRCSSRGRGAAAGARDPLTPAPRPRVCYRALFRLGNSLFAMGQPAAAEAAYLEALRVMDEDLDDDGEVEEEEDETSGRKKRASSSSSSSDARLATSLRVNLGISLEAQGMLAAAADQYAAAATAADGLAESEREKWSSAVSFGGVAEGQAPTATTAAATTTTAAAAAAEKPLPPHHPAHSRAYKLLGSALFALGRPAAARDALRRALSLDPRYADAHSDLGCALCALGDAAGAAAAFSAALRASSSSQEDGGESESSDGKEEDTGPHREALFNLANLRRQTGDFAAAVCGYDRVLALEPGHWRAHLGRAVALLGSRRDGDARGALRIAFALSGVNPLALEAELKMLREAAAAPNPERATLAAAMAAIAERAAAEVTAGKR